MVLSENDHVIRLHNNRNNVTTDLQRNSIYLWFAESVKSNISGAGAKIVSLLACAGPETVLLHTNLAIVCKVNSLPFLISLTTCFFV